MTDTKTYQVNGASVIITARNRQYHIDLNICVDLSALDADEPDHSDHNLIKYQDLPSYKTGQSYWWAKTYHNVTVHTGSQARRVIKNALVKIDDAISAAIIARNARKAEMAEVWK